MLHEEALVALSHAINSLVLTTKSPKAVLKFKPTSKADLWRWIGQRLDITLNVKLQLKEAYKSVSIFRSALFTATSYFPTQDKVDSSNWLPEHRFAIINSSIRPDIKSFCRLISSQWQRAWEPGAAVVVDESVYDFQGQSPCHAFIPRKPHPNGLMSYGLSGYTAKMKLPMLLDIEPWVPSNKLSARESAKSLMTRAKNAHPRTSFKLVMDSAFGSFKDVDWYHNLDIEVTMSMAENKDAWIWELLAYGCPLESGRVALRPLLGSAGHYLVSLFRTQSDAGKMIDIRTVTSAFEYEAPPMVEDTVVSVAERILTASGDFEYLTTWADGDITRQRAPSFLDPDGTFNYIWLRKAKCEDVQAALSEMTAEKLVELCDQQKWKVLPLYCFFGPL